MREQRLAFAPLISGSSNRKLQIFNFQAVRSPRGCPVRTERGNGHRTGSPAGKTGIIEAPGSDQTDWGTSFLEGRSGSPRPRSTPGFFPDLPPFPEANIAYGSATVRPYVGAVKSLLLPIVALAINPTDASYFHRSLTTFPPTFLKAKRKALGPFPSLFSYPEMPHRIPNTL